jgi:alpha-beta hydrolase superfamily lysophospholipase
MLAVWGTSDEMCPYEDVRAFVEAARSARLDAELVTLDGASHFFVFNNPAARAQASERVVAFLARWR